MGCGLRAGEQMCATSVDLGGGWSGQVTVAVWRAAFLGRGTCFSKETQTCVYAQVMTAQWILVDCTAAESTCEADSTCVCVFFGRDGILLSRSSSDDTTVFVRLHCG